MLPIAYSVGVAVPRIGLTGHSGFRLGDGVVAEVEVEFEDGADVQAVMTKVRENCKKVEDDCEVFL